MSVFRYLPKEVLIGEQNYPVEYVKKPDNDKTLAGIIFYNEKIQVCSIMERDLVESTLIHEIIHGISRDQGLRLCEVSVKKLEIGFFEVFKKNGWKISTR